MDKSVDSIGSCSLDVDADSSEKSDTSGSLNFPTPISIKDITRDFVANINERCPVRKIDTTATLMNSLPSSQAQQTISTQPTGELAPYPSAFKKSIATEVGNDKKPSYLNLACCVNGYSNITTYDSKIRQDINKSREVSPIRPSASSIQYCKKNDFLAPPKLQKMTTNKNSVGTDINHDLMHANGYENGHGHGHRMIVTKEDTEAKNTSFIQQQMERLYGPAALAQGFYSPKKIRNSAHKQRTDNPTTSELKLKFKELSPSKDYSEFRRKINGAAPQTMRAAIIETNPDNNNIDLPVLRHLSQEFRAQLPKISPKRNLLRSEPSEDDENAPMQQCDVNGKYIRHINHAALDQVDHQSIVVDVGATAVANLIESAQAMSLKNDNQIPTEAISKDEKTNDVKTIVIATGDSNNKDGHYFLKILKAEGDRLLSLAAKAEQYIEDLSNQTDVGEEVFGLLRSASGKARLLVSQKMKQFQGLCHKNVNYTPGEACRTTEDDLQGFWDMVYLQVEDINTIFSNVERLKSNNWKQIEKPENGQSPSSAKKQNKILKPNLSAANGNSKSSKPKSAEALERESQRKQKLLEMKRQKKLELAANVSRIDGGGDKAPTSNILIVESPVEILVNENKS